MKNKELARNLNGLGFPVFNTEKPQDANRTLAAMVLAKDVRFWEGFPVVLANSANKGLFTYDSVKAGFKELSDKSIFDSLIAMSLALYNVFNLKFSWSGGLYKILPTGKKREKTVFSKRFEVQEDFNIGTRKMSPQRLKALFENYFTHSHNRLDELLSVKDEMRLEYALSQIFSAKQKELFLKKLQREKLTKTEKEYYSRTIKKKVLALANTELHNLAQRLLSE